MAPLVSGIAGLSASSSTKKGDTEHLMQKLQDVTVTLHNN